METTPWDVIAHLTCERAIEGYLEAARETGDPVFIQAALKDVGKARARIRRQSKTPEQAPGRSKGT